jgi:Ca2+-binding RTX toxin-like protein
VAIACGLVALALPATAAAVDHRVMIKEVYAGTAGAVNGDFIELQMFGAGQNLVSGNEVHVYDSTGLLQDTYTFPANVAGSANQSSLQVSRTEGATFFGVPADLLDASVAVPFGAGKACYEDVDNVTAGIIDCVSWGSYTGDPNGEDATPGTADDTGTPAPPIPDGNALARDLTGGSSATLLDAGDDTNSSGADFDVLAVATPRNNAGAVTTTAADAGISAGTLEVDAAAGVLNRLMVARRAGGVISVVDTKAPIDSGSGCSAERTNETRCPAASITAFDVSAGDQADTVGTPSGTTDATVDGGAGNDRITTRTGEDLLTGGDGADTLNPGTGRDVIDGGTGPDTASYAPRTAAEPVDVDIDGIADDGNLDDEVGGVRDNVLTNVERLIGGAGDDELTGSGAGNRLTGGDGADTLTGLGGNDLIFADDGAGTDVVNCGPGANDHVFADPGDTFATVGPDACELVN